jgi:hypothetical protein
MLGSIALNYLGFSEKAEGNLYWESNFMAVIPPA